MKVWLALNFLGTFKNFLLNHGFDDLKIIAAKVFLKRVFSVAVFSLVMPRF